MNHHRHASVLVLALWTLMVLGFLALAVGSHVAANMQAARYLRYDSVALHLARGGVEMAWAEILKNPTNVDCFASSELVSHVDRYRGNTSLGGGSFSVFSARFDTNTQRIVTCYGVMPEWKKVDVDVWPRGGTSTQELEQILQAMDASPSLAGAILQEYPASKSKVVADQTSNRYGWYEALPELLAVPGMDRVAFEGLEPLVTTSGLKWYSKPGSDAAIPWRSYGGIAEGCAMIGTSTAAVRRVSFVFGFCDRATNLLYWREH